MPTCVEVEDATHDNGLGSVDRPIDMGAQRTSMRVYASRHIDVAIPEHAASNAVALTCALGVSFMHALCSVLAVCFVGSATHRGHGLSSQPVGVRERSPM
jgi:hypothetical protein